jgi:hypothetical protein
MIRWGMISLWLRYRHSAGCQALVFVAMLINHAGMGMIPGRATFFKEQVVLFGFGGYTSTRAAWPVQARFEAELLRSAIYSAGAPIRAAAFHTAPQREQLRLGLRLLDMVQPTGGPWHWTGVKPGHERRMQPDREARPRPVICLAHQSRPQRVALHVAQHRRLGKRLSLSWQGGGCYYRCVSSQGEPGQKGVQLRIWRRQSYRLLVARRVAECFFS